MDDGSKSRNSIYLNTQQFGYNDQLILLTKLSDLGIKAALNKDKNYYRIRIAVESVAKLKKQILIYMHKSMLYKIP